MRYRTTGPRLLARSGGKVLLVHDGWLLRSGTVIVLPDADELGWEFSADPRRLRRQPARRSRSASTVSRKRLRRHRSLRGAGSRELLVHMIEEYARHNGHADLLRERIDGRVGQYAPCDTRIRRPLPGTRGRRIMGSSG